MTRVRKAAGWLLVLAVAGIMIFAGSGKALGFAPPEVTEGMKKHGLFDHMQLIGWGELAAALLFLWPRTSSLGVLATSGFWGGTIAFHMANGEPYLLQSGFLLATWFGAALRDRRTLASFTDPWGG